MSESGSEGIGPRPTTLREAVPQAASRLRGIFAKIKRANPQPAINQVLPDNEAVVNETTSEIVDPTSGSEEVVRPEIPVPGTAPIPEGHIRLFHFTSPKRLESIRTQGLTNPSENTHGHSADIGLNSAPNSTWVYSDLNLKEPPGWTIGRPYLEFSAPPDDMGPHNAVSKEGTAARTLKPGVDIPPERIIAVHEPWHEMVRHSSNGVIDPEWLKSYIDRSVQIAGNFGTRGNYTDYYQIVEQQQYLDSQVAQAKDYLKYSEQIS